MRRWIAASRELGFAEQLGSLVEPIQPRPGLREAPPADQRADDRHLDRRALGGRRGQRRQPIADLGRLGEEAGRGRGLHRAAEPAPRRLRRAELLVARGEEGRVGVRALGDRVEQRAVQAEEPRPRLPEVERRPAHHLLREAVLLAIPATTSKPVSTSAASAISSSRRRRTPAPSSRRGGRRRRAPPPRGPSAPRAARSSGSSKQAARRASTDRRRRARRPGGRARPPRERAPSRRAIAPVSRQAWSACKRKNGTRPDAATTARVSSGSSRPTPAASAAASASVSGPSARWFTAGWSASAPARPARAARAAGSAPAARSRG